ncbi:hypothetical protein ACFVP8_12910 [Viridibacillus arvi]|uniref:hypothetical protein n=1 Tax=Viridibacillus arvi TaxID=263475 RepID=UPI00369530B4
MATEFFNREDMLNALEENNTYIVNDKTYIQIDENDEIQIDGNDDSIYFYLKVVEEKELLAAIEDTDDIDDIDDIDDDILLKEWRLIWEPVEGSLNWRGYFLCEEENACDWDNPDYVSEGYGGYYGELSDYKAKVIESLKGRDKKTIVEELEGLECPKDEIEDIVYELVGYTEEDEVE